jgi:SH3-like domain-containing protein
LLIAALAMDGAAFSVCAQTPTRKPPSAKAAPEPAKPAAPAAAPTPADESVPDAKEETAGRAEGGLPIPRFVSLRTDPINLRTGPGVRYPVEWVYRRRHLPVEVVAEFDTWRRIRDPDGTEGWVHQSMLTGRRTAVVKGGIQLLRRTNADNAGDIASLEAGVIVNVQRCPAGPFCRVEVNGLQGWLKRDQVWGVYPDEIVE